MGDTFLFRFELFNFLRKVFNTCDCVSNIKKLFVLLTLGKFRNYKKNLFTFFIDISEEPCVLKLVKHSAVSSCYYFVSFSFWPLLELSDIFDTLL